MENGRVGLTVSGYCPSLWEIQGKLVISYPQSRAEHNELMQACQCSVHSLHSDTTQDPVLGEWHCPQWARSSYLDKCIQDSLPQI